jgi:hypothetical protein
MNLQKIVAVVSLMLVFSLASIGWAGNHAVYIGDGPFKNGPEVTKKCIECHEKQSKDFMTTVHWTWSSEQVVNGKKGRSRQEERPE